MRFHTQTAGVSLTAQQPLNNIVRTAIEALAGVLGGTQSLHTNSYDEALALPTEDAVRIALRTQQIIAHETGVTNTIDPLGGSYFVEALTDQMEEQAYAYFAKIDELGGMVEAVKRNYPQREIADAAFELQAKIDDHEQRRRRRQPLHRGRRRRDADPAHRPRAGAQADRPRAGRARPPRRRRGRAPARRPARGRGRPSANLMPNLMECARAHATEGEMVDALQHVWGAYTRDRRSSDDAHSLDRPRPVPLAGRRRARSSPSRAASRSATTTSSARAACRPSRSSTARS